MITWPVEIPADWCVFPLEPPIPGDEDSGKAPWPGCKWRDASRPLAQWENWPAGANMGVDCYKSGLVVVDEDQPGAVQRWLGRDLPITYTVKTPRGTHYYFKAPVGVTVGSRNGIAPGVDIKAEGGYVVAPGSVHYSGPTYVFGQGW